MKLLLLQHQRPIRPWRQLCPVIRQQHMKRQWQLLQTRTPLPQPMLLSQLQFLAVQQVLRLALPLLAHWNQPLVNKLLTSFLLQPTQWGCIGFALCVCLSVCPSGPGCLFGGGRLCDPALSWILVAFTMQRHIWPCIPNPWHIFWVFSEYGIEIGKTTLSRIIASSF